MQKNVIETAGKSPTDPGEGTFAAGYYAEDYAHMNPKGRAFVLAAYNMENMRLATEEESRGNGRNHRYVPTSGALHDAFKGAILVEMDSQVPDTTAVKERIDSKKEEWLQEIMESYKLEVARLAEGGISYSTNEDELATMLLKSAEAFTEHYGNYALSYESSLDDILKRLSDHGMFSYLMANQLPYSLQAKPGTDMELFTEAISLSRKLSSILLSKCESAVKQLFQEYNPERKI